MNSQPLVGSIIDSSSAFEAMKGILSTYRQKDVWLISAYLKAEALKALTSEVDDSNRVAIVARWAGEDLISGSSDLESYLYARGRGWRFFARTDLHAKAYRLGSDAIFMGSGNLTSKGFSLAHDCNRETMVKIDASETNINSLQRIFDGSVEITKELYKQLEEWVLLHSNEHESLISSWQNYPLDLAMTGQGKQIKPNCIAVSECLLTDGQWLESLRDVGLRELSEEELHDLSLLGYTEPMKCTKVSQEELSRGVCKLRIIVWIKMLVAEMPGNQIYFGELSSDFHSILLDDPRPSRQGIKKLLANALSWIARFPESGLKIDRPNHSQRVCLDR